jgi:hypothetical protein
MKILRKILGIFVMIAGILGLLISLAGLVGVWLGRTPVLGYANTTIATLQESITTSKDVMEITVQALGATIDSVDALSDMLGTTALTIEDTQPVVLEIDAMLADTLPATLSATVESLYTAQNAAVVMESSIKTLDNFRFMLSATPLIGAMVESPTDAYNPDKPLADTLGELAVSLEDLPVTFTTMADSLSGTDENLGAIQANLNTMSTSVSHIADSLGEYQAMIRQSQSSMDNVAAILTNIQANLGSILKWGALGLSLFLVWLLAAQVVIFSQGWELYQGTAGRMEKEEETETA